jgi:predicted anti-sigma-YlaC factor YlaD
VITTTGGLPRNTVTTADCEPNAFEQTTVIVFVPFTSATALVVVLVDAAPLTVHVVPAGIVVVPLTVYVTLMTEFVVVLLLAGDVITRPGPLGGNTVMTAGTLDP